MYTDIIARLHVLVFILMNAIGENSESPAALPTAKDTLSC